MSVRARLKDVLEEAGYTLSHIRPEQAEALCELLAGEPAVFVTGEGRSGLVARCFAMRLMHLEIAAHVAGETVTPRLQVGEVLLAVSRTGETAATCAIARAAQAAGGRVAAITAEPASSLGQLAALIIVVPSERSSAQYGGAAFEQATLLLLDAIALELQHRLGQTPDQMDARHTNLE